VGINQLFVFLWWLAQNSGVISGFSPNTNICFRKSANVDLPGLVWSVYLPNKGNFSFFLHAVGKQ
jgi:hypothetical protein